MKQLHLDGSHAASAQINTHGLELRKADQSLLSGVADLASAYPYPHSILGCPGAGAYVQKMAVPGRCPGEGWYAALWLGEVIGAVHLALYGVGDGRGHTLWKIRHPLAAARPPANCLTFLFRSVPGVAAGLRRGTHKFVMFVGEHEREVMRQARDAGFEQEACFKDYYRLGESCLVWGKTLS